MQTSTEVKLYIQCHESMHYVGCICNHEKWQLIHNIYIFNVVILDEGLILDAFHFSMNNTEKSGDLGHMLGWSYVDVSH